MNRAFDLFVTSDGEGPVVVLVHGGWTDHRTWDDVVANLSDSHRVVRYDRRGHSRSTWAGPVPRRQDEDDLASLVELLGAPVHLVGNSYGASISLGLAGRRPELVASMAAHEPPLLGVARRGTALHHERDVIVGTLEQVAAEIRRGRPEVGARRFVEEVAIGPGAWAMLPADIKATMVANAHTLVGTLDDPGWSVLEAAAPAAVPLLLTDGTTSPAWLRHVTDELAASVVPHATRLTLDGAGHVPHLTGPAQYAAAIRRFVTSTTPPMTRRTTPPTVPVRS